MDITPFKPNRHCLPLSFNCLSDYFSFPLLVLGLEATKASGEPSRHEFLHGFDDDDAFRERMPLERFGSAAEDFVDGNGFVVGDDAASLHFRLDVLKRGVFVEADACGGFETPHSSSIIQVGDAGFESFDGVYDAIHGVAPFESYPPYSMILFFGQKAGVIPLRQVKPLPPVLR